MEQIELHTKRLFLKSITPEIIKELFNSKTKEGTMREDYGVNGKNEDADCYSLLKWEWENQK